MFTKKWITLSVLLALLGLMVLSACQPAATATPAKEVPTVPVAQATEIAPTVTVVPAPAAGGKITLAFPYEPASLDPQTEVGGSLFVPYMFSSMLAKDLDGKLVPYIAKSWEISSDSLVYTFHLKDNVKFHNGDPMTARDWVYSFDRILNPATASPYAGDLASVASYKAVDDYTFVVTLSAPNYYFIQAMANNLTQVVMSKRAVEESGDKVGSQPVGTGPFILDKWVTAERLLLKRNPDFTWGPAYNLGNPPLLDQIEIRFIPEDATINAGLEAGELDFVEEQSYQQVQQLKDLDNVNFVTSPYPGANHYLAFNQTVAPFDDVRVRQAIAQVINREAIIKVIAPGGDYTIAYGPLNPVMEGYWPGVEKIGYSYKPEQAAALLQEAGFSKNASGMWEKDGVTLGFAIKMMDNQERSSIAQIVQAQLAEFGIKVDIETVERGVYRTDVMGGKFVATMLSFTWTDSSSLNMMFKSGAGFNLSKVNDPTLDEMLNKMTATGSEEIHQQWANEAQKRIVEQAYLIPTINNTMTSVISKRVAGYKFNNPNFVFNFTDAYIVP